MQITELIPQREPFLFINEIQECNPNDITTKFYFRPELDFFKGHFPDMPVVPGVILNEHCFQSAAAFIACQTKEGFGNQLAVVSRIQMAKFKNLVKPEDTITSKTTLIERIANAAFFKSTVSNQENKKVLHIEFSVALTEK